MEPNHVGYLSEMLWGPLRMCRHAVNYSNEVSSKAKVHRQWEEYLLLTFFAASEYTEDVRTGKTTRISCQISYTKYWPQIC